MKLNGVVAAQFAVRQTQFSLRQFCGLCVALQYRSEADARAWARYHVGKGNAVRVLPGGTTVIRITSSAQLADP